jgi:C_GCAxxG_C_C family probable redox protein
MMTEKEVTDQFMQGFDCAQITLDSAAGKTGLTQEEAYRLAAGFGAGMFQGGTCGAVTGAIIALGAKYGHFKPGDMERKNATMAKVVEFQQRFKEKYDSTLCRDMLGYDLSKPEEMEIVMKEGLLLDFCPKATAYAIGLLEELMD